MDSVIGNTWMYLCLICAVLLWIVYHKLVHVYYVDLFRGICKEIFFSLFFGILLGTAIIEYSCAAEPPVRCGVSHLSRRNEPFYN